MRSKTVVTVSVGCQDPAQMRLATDDCVIETLATDRSDQHEVTGRVTNFSCDKVRGLLPKSRGPHATWGQAEEPGVVAFEGCAEGAVVQT